MQGFAKGALFCATGQREVQGEGFVESVTSVVAAFTADLRAKLSTKNLEQWRLSLIFNHMNTTRLLMEACIKNSLQVNGQKLVGISLLSDSISTPDCRQGSEYSHWVRPFTLPHLSYEVDVATLVAFLRSLALFSVCLGEAERVEGQRVCEALHN